MNRDTAMWRKGQVDALTRLTDVTEKVLALHSKKAAKAIDGARFSHNQAWHILDAEQDPEPEAEADGAARSTDGAGG